MINPNFQTNFQNSAMIRNCLVKTGQNRFKALNSSQVDLKKVLKISKCKIIIVLQVPPKKINKKYYLYFI